MPRLRRLGTALIIVPLTVLLHACATPPDKEINQAQGAIDAARAAGAEQYASEDYAASAAALARAQAFVDQRDYRQALSQALDARERAKEAARRASQQRAATRSAAEFSLAEVTAAVQQVRTMIAAAQTARAPAKDVTGLQDVMTVAENALQEARAALSRDEYTAAVSSLNGRAQAVRSAIAAFEDATGARGSRRRR